MAVATISPNSFFQSLCVQNNPNRFQQLRTEFQKLGQDLQAGNMQAAQNDFTALAKNLPGQQSAASSFSQAISSLSEALQSGSVTAAQQAFSQLQQGAKQTANYFRPHNHHVFTGGPFSGQLTSLTQAFSGLGQALQSGDVSAAQQAYAALAQEFPQLTSAGALSSAPAASNVNLTI
jgi:ribosomal protein S20